MREDQVLLGSWVSTGTPTGFLSFSFQTKTNRFLCAHGLQILTTLLTLPVLQPIQEELQEALARLHSGSAANLSEALGDSRHRLLALLPQGVGQKILSLAQEKHPGLLGDGITKLAHTFRVQGDYSSAQAFYHLAATFLRNQPDWEGPLTQVETWLDTLNGGGTLTSQLQLRLEELPHAVSSPLLAGMVAGGLAHSLSCRLLANALRGRVSTLIQVGLAHSGAMLADATAFSGVERGLQIHQGMPVTESYSKTWTHALWTMTHLRGASLVGRTLSKSTLVGNALRSASHSVAKTFSTALPHISEMSALYVSQSVAPYFNLGEKSFFVGLDTLFTWGHFRMAGACLGLSIRYQTLRQQLAHQAESALRQGAQATYHSLNGWLSTKTRGNPGFPGASTLSWALASRSAGKALSPQALLPNSPAHEMAQGNLVSQMSSKKETGKRLYSPDTVLEILHQHRGDLGEDGDRVISRLVADFTAQEVHRTRFSAPPSSSTPQKTLYYFDGLPGVGKTTQIENLRTVLGFGYLSMKDFCIERGIHQKERRRHQAEHGELTVHDLDFIEAIANSPHKHLILEKFPRSPLEAKALVEQARKENWQIHVIHLAFPQDPIGNSVRRQLARGPREGENLTPQYAIQRALLNFARDTSGRWTLADLDVPVHTIDANLPERKILGRIRQAVGLGFENLPWHLEPLQELAQVSGSLGIEAWVSGGHLYRPFFNGRYGPPQQPTDVDVTVTKQEEVRPLLRKLKELYPQRHWSVFCHCTHIERKFGIKVNTLQEARAYTPFTHKAGLVRWHNHRLEVYLVPGAEAALRDGVISLNHRLFNHLPAHQHAKFLEESLDKLPDILSKYPGLSLAPELARLFEERYATKHQPKIISQDWDKLKREVIGNEKQLPNSVAHNRRPLDGDELPLGEEIVRLHQEMDFTPQAQPLPPWAPLPEILETQRSAREKLKARMTLTPDEDHLSRQDIIPPPTGHHSWLHYMARETEDGPWQNWILNQAFHHRPIGGADPYLARVLSLEMFLNLRHQKGGRQSPMHQGAPLKQHLANTMLALATDPLMEKYKGQMAQDTLKDLRAGMRMAMLFHDTGKILDVDTAGRHAAISARLWEKHYPKEWFPRDQVGTVAWMVHYHDIYGRFTRALIEKKWHPRYDFNVHPNQPTSYPGGLDVQAVRTRVAQSGLPYELAIDIITEVNKADVGSVPPLRPMLSVMPTARRLIAMRPPPKPRQPHPPGASASL